MNQWLASGITETEKPVTRGPSAHARTLVITFLVTYREMRYDNPTKNKYDTRSFVDSYLMYVTVAHDKTRPPRRLIADASYFVPAGRKAYIAPECRRYFTCRDKLATARSLIIPREMRELIVLPCEMNCAIANLYRNLYHSALITSQPFLE